MMATTRSNLVHSLPRLSLSRLPVDCGCLIFRWLEWSEQIELSRVDRYWYGISDKRQAYAPYTLPSFSKDGFDLGEYDRWNSHADRSLRMSVRELVVRSRSRIIQHQTDMKIVFDLCHGGQFHGIGDGIHETDFQASLNRFHSVRCLRIDINESACDCWSTHDYQSLFPGGTRALVIRTIQAWAKQIISFQLRPIPLLASQLFDSMIEQSVSMPYLQHAAISTEPKDVYAILKHGFHVSSEPAGYSNSSQPSSSSTSSFIPGGVLRLMEPRSRRSYEPDIEHLRRNTPILTDPKFFQSLLHAPYHLVLATVDIAAQVPWCLQLPSDLLRIHLLSLELCGKTGAIQSNWRKSLQMKDTSFDLSPFMHLFQSFKSLVYEIDPSEPSDMNVFMNKLCKLIPQPPQSQHPSLSAPSSPLSGCAVIHPFLPVDCFTLEAPESVRRLIRLPPPMRIHQLNRIFPRLNQIRIDPRLSIDLNIDWSTFNWLHHLTLGLGGKGCHPATGLSERDYLCTIVVELSHLRTLNLQLGCSYRADGSEVEAYQVPDRYHLLDCLVLAHPSLESVQLRHHLPFLSLHTTKQLRLYQQYLMYLHLLWHQIQSSHTIPPVTTLHPMNRSSLSPLLHSILPRGVQLLLSSRLKSLDHYRPVVSSDSDGEAEEKKVKLSVRVREWFKRLGKAPPSDEERRVAEEAEAKNYLALESDGLAVRVNGLLQSVHQSTIHPRASSFHFQFGDRYSHE